jgi:methionyl-tRNA formyltransferase
MRIAVFTSNQARHISLIESLTTVADEVLAIMESNTIHPGRVQDFYAKSAVMQAYFERVLAAERELFGEPRFLPSPARAFVMKGGDINLLPCSALRDALNCDVIVVFGASYIKGDLCDALVQRRALNIHMGVSPYYRGSSCNFWALYDRHPELVGATIHLLSKGLDSGSMLFHALPAADAVDGFRLGMRSVQAAHEGLVDAIRRGWWQDHEPVLQDKSLEIRYTRNAQFNDEVAAEYLSRMATPEEILRTLQNRDHSKFLRLYVPPARCDH